MRLKFLTLLAGCALAAYPLPANAGHAWFFNGTWVHTHSRTLPVFQQLSATSNASADVTLAVWDNATILSLPETTCHDCARIHELEGNFGDTGWIGLASADGWDGAHFSHGHAMYTRFYLETDAMKPGVTCHEEGHLLGLGHDFAQASLSCMALNYTTWGSLWPSTHDIDTINAMYPAWGH